MGCDMFIVRLICFLACLVSGIDVDGILNELSGSFFALEQSKSVSSKLHVLSLIDSIRSRSVSGEKPNGSKSDNLAAILDLAHQFIIDQLSLDAESVVIKITHSMQIISNPSLSSLWLRILGSFTEFLDLRPRVTELASKIGSRAQQLKVRSVQDLALKIAAARQVLSQALFTVEVESLLGSLCIWLSRSDSPELTQLLTEAEWAFTEQRRRLNLPTVNTFQELRMQGRDHFTNFYGEPMVGNLVADRSAFFAHQSGEFEKILRIGEKRVAKMFDRDDQIAQDCEKLKVAHKSVESEVVAVEVISRYLSSKPLRDEYKRTLEQLARRMKTGPMPIPERLLSANQELIDDIQSLDNIAGKLDVAESIIERSNAKLSTEIEAVLGNLAVWLHKAAERRDPVRTRILKVLDSLQWALITQRKVLGLPLLKSADCHGRPFTDVVAEFNRDPRNSGSKEFRSRYSSLPEARAVRLASLYAAVAHAMPGEVEALLEFRETVLAAFPYSGL